MPISRLNIDEFLKREETLPILDVRSPGEYDHAHIPGAVSLPLFTDEERKMVGTAYKKESREKAIKIGLDYFGKKMVTIVETAEKIIADKKPASREVVVHCWRGGMRSAAIAWLLDLYGFKVLLLTGGYKTYRRWVNQQFEKEYKLLIVGGYTGGNKTGIIHELKLLKEAVIDLENLAAHKGSVFGNLDMIKQPTQEHFENLLAKELNWQSTNNISGPIWVEGESQRIGNVNIPFVFFKKMRVQTTFFMDIPFQERLQHIMEVYGKYKKENLINCIVRIKKKLGGLETKNAVNALLEEDVSACFTILLKYYDKLYLKSTYNTSDGGRKIIMVKSDSTNPKLNAEKLMHYAYI